MRIAINGVGVGGPTLAYWLQRSGHEVLLVEQSPGLRRGGYAIDFWGVGYDIAEKMRLLPRIEELGWHMKEMRYVDRRGRVTGGFPIGIFDRMTGGRFIELRRSDLAAALYGALEGKVETIFGDSVARIIEDGGQARIEFDHASPRDVDLVVGADGLHSRVREIAFGRGADFEVPLGYHVAAFELEDYRPRDELVAVSHAAPGRQITRLSMPDGRTLCLFVFRDEHMDSERPSTDPERRAVLTSVFAGVGWECPRILAAMKNVGAIYFDRVSQIRMDRWTKGRVAMIGDAAACVSLLAGEGTGLAMAEAYVLAGELRVCGDDLAAAFSRYEGRMMPLLRRKQESALRFASSFAPKTALGVAFRDRVSRLLEIPFVARLLVGRAVRDDFALPAYGF